MNEISISLQIAICQFQSFGNSGRSGSCDYQALNQGMQNKMRCTEQFYDLKLEAMREIQKSDP